MRSAPQLQRVERPKARARQQMVLTPEEINTNRKRVIGLLGAVLGACGLVVGLHDFAGKTVPPDSKLGQKLAPIAEAYATEAARFGNFGEMFTAYQPREDERRTSTYRTPLEEIEDQRTAVIEDYGCTDKSGWTVEEPAFEVNIHHMVANIDTRVNADCQTNKADRY